MAVTTSDFYADIHASRGGYIAKGHAAQAAPPQTDGTLNKAEGSRGGHIIGHTKSGKPIYLNHEADSSHYKGFTKADHLDAAMRHNHLGAHHLGEMDRHRKIAASVRWAEQGKHIDAAEMADKLSEFHGHLASTHAFHAGVPANTTGTGTIVKARGEGSRGGHIIGRTKSGKPIYEASDSRHAATRRPFARMSSSSPVKRTHDTAATAAIDAHPRYSAQDHADAADLHQRRADALGTGNDEHGHHSAWVGRAHRVAAGRLGDEDIEKQSTSRS